MLMLLLALSPMICYAMQQNDEDDQQPPCDICGHIDGDSSIFTYACNGSCGRQICEECSVEEEDRDEDSIICVECDGTESPTHYSYCSCAIHPCVCGRLAPAAASEAGPSEPQPQAEPLAPLLTAPAAGPAEATPEAGNQDQEGALHISASISSTAFLPYHPCNFHTCP